MRTPGTLGTLGTLVLVGSLLGACSPEPTSVGPDPSPERSAKLLRAEMGDAVRLRVGETVEVGDGGLRVRFAAVPADSRCPTGVTCVWAGDATVQLGVSVGDGGEVEAELHTTDGPGSLRHEGHTVTLLGLEPHPVYGSEIPEDAYVAVLQVTRP